MDADRFDRLACALTATGSRRSALAALLAGMAGLLGPAATVARKGKKGRGNKKKKGKKKRGTQSVSPPAPPCANLPDDAPCDGGKCFKGACNPRPTCPPFGAPCAATAEGTDCCSDICRLTQLGSDEGTCSLGEEGAPCFSGTDCQARFSCAGYRCRLNTL